MVHQLPQKPSNLRVRTWRRLRNIGAISIKNAVYVLPFNDKTSEDFQWLKQEIESVGGEASLFRALSGVTAAVVGVVLNLALVFGGAVIFPNGITGDVDWFSAAMTLAAFVVLYKFKADVLSVVLGGGLIGLLWTLFMG